MRLGDRPGIVAALEQVFGVLDRTLPCWGQGPRHRASWPMSLARPSGPAHCEGSPWRSVFSACFRAVEGDLLDVTFRRFNVDGAGGQLVLPLYDGALVSAPLGAEQDVAGAAEEAAVGAAKELGISMMTATVRRMG